MCDIAMRHNGGRRCGSTYAAGNFVTSHSDKGVPIVDLALKFDVLVVCAVFVFVGAILLGAY